jgi:hypothetical protein
VWGSERKIHTAISAAECRSSIGLLLVIDEVLHSLTLGISKLSYNSGGISVYIREAYFKNNKIMETPKPKKVPSRLKSTNVLSAPHPINSSTAEV